MAVYFDSDHAHDQVTQISVSGILCFFGSIPIIWTSKRYGTIKISGYSLEFFAVRVVTEKVIA